MHGGVRALTETTGKAALAKFACLYRGTVLTAPGLIAFIIRHRSDSHFNLAYGL